MMTVKEMRAYRDEKIKNLYKDNKYKSLLESIEQRMINSIDKNPGKDMFTFNLPNDILPSVILDMLDEYGYPAECDKNILKIYLVKKDE